LEKWCNKWKIEDEDRRQRQFRGHGHRVVQRSDVPGSRWTRNSYRIRQTESQSDQSKIVPHNKQNIEASTSEQSDAHQVGSSTTLTFASAKLAPEETPSCGKYCAQDSDGRRDRQKLGHPANFEVHHRSERIKQSVVKIFQKAESTSKISYLREAVN